MQLSICTAIIASLAGIEPCLALPWFRWTDNTAKDVKLTEQEEEALKYFHEPGYVTDLQTARARELISDSGDDLNHYDRRYFHGKVSDSERTDTQSHMIRAYLSFFHEHGIDTWLAHGTLLGWWWNGTRLPWDYDLDTQVSHQTLQLLGRSYNQTLYHDDTSSREFLLDVNPWIWQRGNGDGMNVIDARWIDVRNGLYVDITGLSEMDPVNEPGVVSCKNYHYYQVQDLYPMRDTVFEGVSARVPYRYESILRDEYHDGALVDTDYYGYVSIGKWENI